MHFIHFIYCIVHELSEWHTKINVSNKLRGARNKCQISQRINKNRVCVFKNSMQILYAVAKNKFPINYKLFLMRVRTAYVSLQMFNMRCDFCFSSSILEKAIKRNWGIVWRMNAHHVGTLHAKEKNTVTILIECAD